MRVAVIKAHPFTAALLIGMTLGALYGLLAAGDAVIDILAGILALAFIPLGLERLALKPSRPACAVWAAILVLQILVAFGKFARESAILIPAFGATGVLVLVVGCLWIALTRFDPMPRPAKPVFGIAFGLQCLAAVLEVLDPPPRVIDFAQFAALQFYLAAAVLFVISRKAAWLSQGHAALGDLARFLFVYAGYYDRLRYPDPRRRARPPFAREVTVAGHFLLWFPKLVGPVRRSVGRRAFLQAIDIVLLQWRHRLDAQAYYVFELYRPERRAAAAGYLTRFETKNGLINALNHLYAKRRPPFRSILGDKLSFAELCAEIGVRTVPILARIEGGVVHWSEGTDQSLPLDLFIKPRIGKGAAGAGFYRYIPGAGHQTPSGARVPTDALLNALAAESKDAGPLKRAQLLIQPRLLNHAEIADLANESLIAIRVITCLDRAGGVIVSHAMLRILGTLEPAWGTKVEFAAPIDLETGRLGPMTGDKGEMATRRLDHHPLRPDVRVSGRTIPQFRELLAAAIKAHGESGDRFIVGWDIACTPTGPVILEGNAYLDIEFPQRVHQAPISESPMGPILYRHLMMLDRTTRLFDRMR